MATTTSQKFSLNSNDLLKGLLLAVLTPVLTIVITSLEAGSLTFDWKKIGITALSALIAYLVKNYLSPTQIVITDPSPSAVDAVKQGAEAKIITR